MQKKKMSTTTTSHANSTTGTMRRRKRPRSRISSSFSLVASAATCMATLLSSNNLPTAHALVACNSTEYCQDFFGLSDTECLFNVNDRRDGICSNPFTVGGCLSHYFSEKEHEHHYDHNHKHIDDHHEQWHRRYGNKQFLRVCNSEDVLPDAVDKGHCRLSNLGYGEIRLLAQNWESSFFVSWILQIVLSEILDVPTTMETGVAGLNVNFYDERLSFDYGTSYDWSALRRAHDLGGDCTQADTSSDSGDNYQSCAHVIAEVWQRNQEFQGMIEEGILENPMGMGALGHQSWFIPKMTALQDTSLLTYLGLRGKENQHKIAQTFQWPIRWKDYCEQYSRDNCTSPDDKVQRAPETEDEETLFYAPGGLYRGHFAVTDDNNCTLHPTSCKAHMADFPCEWTSYVLPQAYHNDIAVEPVTYSYSELVQLISAANETKSNILIHWWTPEALYQDFLSTDFELMRIAFPTANQDCLDARINVEDRCSNAFEKQIGDPMGACDEAAFPLQKLIIEPPNSKADTTSDALQSPAYDFIKAFTISDHQLGKIFQAWLKANRDRGNFDPREATCQWVVDNLDLLETFIPKTYPRVFYDNTSISDTWATLAEPLNAFALTFSLFAFVVAMATSVTVFQQRKRRIFEFAQVEFLLLLLVGLILVSFAAMALVIPPGDGSCVLVVWLFNVGYTLEIAPLIVKVAAIGRMMSAARRGRRIIVDRQSLFNAVAALCATVSFFLLLWTVIDPPHKMTEFEVTDQVTDRGETVMTATSFCQSDSQWWRLFSVAWHYLLLVSATVLVLQTRNLQHDVNESQVLAVLIYSHFFFVTLRVLTFLLEDSIGYTTAALYRSVLLSGDIVATVVIYFVPKIFSRDSNIRASRIHATFWNNLLSTVVPNGSDLFRRNSALTDANERTPPGDTLPVPPDSGSDEDDFNDNAEEFVAPKNASDDEEGGRRGSSRRDLNFTDHTTKELSLQPESTTFESGIRCRHCGKVN